MIRQTFGQQVRAHRRERGWTQRQLVEALALHGIKIDAPTVARIEGGNRAVRIEEAAALAASLGCHLGDLLQPATPIERRVGELDRRLAIATAQRDDLAERLRVADREVCELREAVAGLAILAQGIEQASGDRLVESVTAMGRVFSPPETDTALAEAGAAGYVIEDARRITAIHADPQERGRIRDPLRRHLATADPDEPAEVFAVAFQWVSAREAELSADQRRALADKWGAARAEGTTDR